VTATEGVIDMRNDNDMRNSDPFVTVADCRAMLRGVRNALLVMVPVWGVVVWWWLR
jgi:hypothetical protein